MAKKKKKTKGRRKKRKGGEKQTKQNKQWRESESVGGGVRDGKKRIEIDGRKRVGNKDR